MVAQTQEDAGREQNLGTSILGPEFGALGRSEWRLTAISDWGTAGRVQSHNQMAVGPAARG